VSEQKSFLSCKHLLVRMCFKHDKIAKQQATPNMRIIGSIVCLCQLESSDSNL